MKNGCYLTLFIREDRRHGDQLLYEWLLEKARELGIPGGSAFKAIAGFGRHGILHERYFIELGGELPVEVGFLVSEEEADRLLVAIRQEGLRMVYARMPAEIGLVDGADTSV